MRATILIALLLWATAAYSEAAVDIRFFDSSGVEYRTATLGNDIERNNGIKLRNPKVLLIETLDLESTEYKAQNEVLEQLGHEAEDKEVLFVVACSTDQALHGYHTSIEDAKALADRVIKFRVRLLSRFGLVSKSSLQPISLPELQKWLAAE